MNFTFYLHEEIVKEFAPFPGQTAVTQADQQWLKVTAALGQEWQILSQKWLFRPVARLHLGQKNLKYSVNDSRG